MGSRASKQVQPEHEVSSERSVSSSPRSSFEDLDATPKDAQQGQHGEASDAPAFRVNDFEQDQGEKVESVVEPASDALAQQDAVALADQRDSLATLRQAALKSALLKRRDDAQRSADSRSNVTSSDAAEVYRDADKAFKGAKELFSPLASKMHSQPFLDEDDPQVLENATPQEDRNGDYESPAIFPQHAHVAFADEQMDEVDIHMSEDEEGQVSPSQQNCESRRSPELSSASSSSSESIANDSENMDIDYGSSEEEDDHPAPLSYYEYLDRLHELLAWGMPPIVLLQHGVSVFDIRRVLLPHYHAPPPPPPETTPPPMPPPEEASSSRLTIHSQYKPPGQDNPSGPSRQLDVGPAPSLSRAHSAAHEPSSQPAVARPVMVAPPKSLNGKQKNWDVHHEPSVILRYDSRSPSPIPVASPQPDLITASIAAPAELPVVVEPRSSTKSAVADVQSSRQAALKSLRARKGALDGAAACPAPAAAPTVPLDPLQPKDDVLGPELLASGIKDAISKPASVLIVVEAEETEAEETEAEEGEIDDTDLEVPVDVESSIASVQMVRGVKRPSASDFEAQPTASAVHDATLLSRRRMLFGGAARRAAQLVIELSDTSDSSDDEAEEANGIHSFSVDRSRVGSELEASKLLLATKEEEIRLAKERLLEAIRRKKASKKAMIKGQAPSHNSSVAATPVSEEASPSNGPAVFEHNSLAPSFSGVSKGDTKTSQDATSRIDAAVRPPDEETLNVVTHPDMPQPSPISQTTGGHGYLSVPACPSTRFVPYRSVLGHFPFQQRVSDPKHDKHSVRPGVTVHEGLLSSVVLTRVMRDPATQFCAFELAGGVCSDAACPGIHPSRDLHVTDSDLVAYLSRTLPASVSTNQLTFAIQESRRNEPSHPAPLTSIETINNILADAIAILGLAM